MKGSQTPRNAKEVVLGSAIQEFAHKGYSGTSVQDILQATRLSKPTLYYYFGSKAGLFRAILDFAYDECFFANAGSRGQGWRGRTGTSGGGHHRDV